MNELPHFSNPVVDNACYTLDQLSKALGYSASRSLSVRLVEIGCPVVRLGGKRIVSGRMFRLAIEASTNVPDDTTLESGEA